jgi:ATP-dependent Lon protease
MDEVLELALAARLPKLEEDVPEALASGKTIPPPVSSQPPNVAHQ